MSGPTLDYPLLLRVLIFGLYGQLRSTSVLHQKYPCTCKTRDGGWSGGVADPAVTFHFLHLASPCLRTDGDDAPVAGPSRTEGEGGGAIKIGCVLGWVAQGRLHRMSVVVHGGPEC